MFVAVFWLTSLVKKAAKAPLQTDDLFQLHPVFHAHNATKRIKSVMEAHVQETIGEPTKETSRETGESVTLSPKEIALRWGLLRGIFHSEGRKIFFAVLLHFMHLIAQMLAPLLLSMLLNAESRSIRAYFLAVGIFLAQMAQALGWNNSQYFSQGCAMSVKAALISMTQQKALRLGTNGRTKYPSGVIMNLIATDCEVIADSMQYLTDVICVPFEILSLSVLIIVFAGGAGAAGLAFMVLSSICAVYISSMRIAIEKKALAATDERVKVSGEVLNGIKIVKFFAWETAFSERLTLLREEEIRHIFVIRMITTAFAVTMNIVPSFVNAITFSIYAALGNDISAANIFSILSVINLIKLPIAVAPNITQMIFTSFVSLTRLAKFFAAEEIETPVDTVEDISSKVALKSVIKFENANFNWSDAATVEISEEWRTSDSIGVSEAITETEARKDAFGLKNLNIDIRKGSLTLVCGKVGSGKSSLLQAIIGDMIGSGGSAKVFGKIGYCPQQYWLQNISLRENVLFGFPFDETRYNEVIQCCGLSKDLEILPFRDMSVIGDKGVTLSGGQAARVNLARAVYSDADILLLDDPLSAVDSHVGKHILEQCILHYCHDKTVILVSHHLHVAHYADHIIVMDGGEISEQGSFAELIAAENKFKTLMEEFGSHRTSDKEDKGDNITQAKVPTGDTLKESDAKGDDIDEDEERETGKVSLKYFRY
ncbi:hypothetical protein HDU82_003404 [Entophlyctis luteolus]|nr:hypothetical protein HDU82_003404 [Entophlyctis luteolus]